MHDNRWKKKFNYESSFFSIHESNDAEECKEREKKEEWNRLNRDILFL